MEVEPEVGMQELLQALPLVERVPALALKALFDQRTQLDQQQEIQLEIVRRKYATKIKPLLDRASELIEGSTPKPEEVANLNEYLKAGEKAPPLKGKAIDNYWNSALQNSELEPFITQKDSHALEFLLNIQQADNPEEHSTISFTFVFKSNPYFQETKATRRLKSSDGKPICLQGDVLTPKVGAWLTHETRKVTNKSTGQTKAVQGKKIDSFFDIFLNWTLVDHPKQLQKCADIFHELSVVVRESFSFFLGLYELGGSEDQEDYQDEGESQEEQIVKKKR